MYIYLDIVEQFTCEMCGSCCRNEWQVTMDEASYRRNARLFRQTGREREFRMAFIPLQGKTSPGEYAYIAKQADGSCWFLDETNLCRLHREAGHEHLDSVCRTFPRYPMSTARGSELTLSFSCPAVIKLLNRAEPLRVIRSERKPIAFDEGTYTVEVYPKQKPAFDPLRYYFEIEQHVIDILQSRGLSMTQRLQMVVRTIRQMQSIPGDRDAGQELNRIFYSNYDCLDRLSDSVPVQQTGPGAPDVLIEHFLVNLIFKKPFYLYGFDRTLQLIQTIWSRIESVRRAATAAPAAEMIQTAIRNIEFQYGHNRQAILGALPGKTAGRGV
jgi:lysine-N-methylase